MRRADSRLPGAVRSGRSQSPSFVRTVWLAGLALVLLWTVSSCSSASSSQADERFLNLAPDVAYVGDASCATCHEDQHAGYQGHGMANAFYRLTPDNVVEDWGGVALAHPTSGYQYEVRRDGDRFLQVEYRLGPDGARTHELTRSVDYVVGSGSAARTYLTESNGRLYELPLTWYTQPTPEAPDGHWGFSPGYEQGNARFSRTVPERCMACHNGTSEAVPFAGDKYASLASGIGCEQCHGPGALHVEARSETPEPPDSVDVTIVNPKWLSLDLRLDVCQQCHLSGEVSVLRDGETATSFRPGRPLAAHRAVFGTASDDPNRIPVISHADRMKESACFIESAAMDCVTCHDPHDAVPTTASFNATCQSCHAVADLQAALPAGEAQAQHAEGAPCVSCHMPKVAAVDVPHASFTDHKVRVVGRDDRVTGVAGASDDLVPYFAEDEPDGLYASMAYVVLGRQKGRPASTRRGTTRLAQLLADRPEHGEAQFLLGFARLQAGDARGAVAPLEAAVGIDANPERLNALAQAYEALGRTADAERRYLEALAIQPEAARIRTNLGRLRESQGRIDEAIRDYRAAVDEEPWLAQAHTLLGGALAQGGDGDGAIAALRDAVLLEPLQADALTNLGVLLAQAGSEGAGAYLQRAVAADGRNANAHANLALFLVNEGRPQEALASARQALALNPRQATALQVMAVLDAARVP